MSEDVVVITGGTSGVGRACARAFAREGHPVAVLARGREARAATRAELTQIGVPALALGVDVTDAVALDAAADRVAAELGPIGIWVNSAMVTALGTFREVPADDFDRVVDVVFKGTANGTRTALRHLRARDHGRIVQVGSALATRGIPLQAAYCAAKHAVKGLCDSLRAELIHEGSAITVGEVHLPAMNTPQFDMCLNLGDRAPQPVPPIFQPEVAAEAVLEAARTGERTILLTFSTTRTVVGNRVMPASLDRLLGATGFDSQFTDRPRPAGNNLYDPIPGDHGCHGAFDSRSASSSLQERCRHSAAWACWRRSSAARTRLGTALIRPLM